MNPVWAMVLAIVAFFIVLRLRNRGKRRTVSREVFARRIEGFQVTGYLHPEMSNACLFDHGMQFGKGFRRKDGPELPHDENCRCTTIPFSFTSTEVFNGALRNIADIPGTLDGMTTDTSRMFLETLKRLASQPIPDSSDRFLEQSGLEGFPEKNREAIKAFLETRFEFLKEHPTAAGPTEKPKSEAPTEGEKSEIGESI